MATKRVDVEVVGSTAGLKKALNDGSKQVDSFGSHIKSLGKVAAAGMAVAGVAVVGFLVSATKAASANQQAMTRLNTTLKDAGITWKGAGKAVDGYLGRQAVATGFMKGELSDAFAKNVVDTKNAAQSMKLLSVEENVARGAHISLAQAAQIVNKTHEGTFTSLKKLGIAVVPVTTAEDKLTQAHDKLIASGAKLSKQAQLDYKNQLAQAKLTDKAATTAKASAALKAKYAGQSTAYTKTEAGAIDRLKAVYEEIEVEIGNKLLPVVAKLADKAANWIQATSKTKQFHGVIKDLGTIVQHVGQDIQQNIGTAVSVIKTLFSAGQTAYNLYNRFPGVFKAVGVTIAGATAAFKLYTAANKVGAEISGIIKGIQAAYTLLVPATESATTAQEGLNVAETANPIGIVVVAITALIAGLVLLYEKNQTVHAAVQSAFGWMRDNIPPIMHSVETVIKAVWSAIEPYVKAALATVTGTVSNAFDTIKGIVNLFGDIFHGRWGAIWGDLKAIVESGFKTVTTYMAGPLITLLGSEALALGKAIYTGIINGLGDIKGAIESKVTGAVSAAKHDAGSLLGKVGLAFGGVVNRPQVLVGEEAPRHPEVVIPTNPAYHARAAGLFNMTGKALGMPGYATGGVNAAKAEVRKWEAKLKRDEKTEQTLKAWLQNHHADSLKPRVTKKRPHPDMTKYNAYVTEKLKLDKVGTGILDTIKGDNANIKTANTKLRAAIKANEKAVKASDAIPGSTQFANQMSALQAKLAEDDYNNQDPLDNLDNAEKQDLTNLMTLVQGRVSNISSLLPKANATRKAAINQELQSDYGTLKDFRTQLNAPLNTADASDTPSDGGDGGTDDTGDSTGTDTSTTDTGPTADQSAQLAQLQTIGYNTLRAQALGNYSSAVLGGGLPNVTVNMNSLHPGDSATLQAIGTVVTSALDRQPAIGASRQTINI